MEKKNFLIGAGLLTATIAATVAGIFLLPSEVGMQISLSGELNNVVPKWLAIALPASIGGGCAIAYAVKKNNACAIISAIMIAAQIIGILINRELI